MKYSLSEYILYINLKAMAGLFQALPVRLALFIGRVLGILGYLFDSKHKRIAYRNLRTAKAGECSIPQLKRILRKNYQNLGMNLIEILRMPWMNKHYVNRYIKIKGRENLDSVRENQRGTIILGAHFGSWEIYFAIAGILDYPLCIFAEEQTRYPLLDRFLNQTRQKQGISVLRVGQQIRQVIRALQEKKFVGMVADHGAKEGVFVDFFGRKTRTPTAAVRISLKFDLPILVVYLRRVKGPEHELVISPPLAIKRTGNLGEDIISNLEMINRITEGYISKYPEQYLWFYKRFKYSSQRNILILYDGKVGHLRQGEALVKLIENIADQRHLEIKTKVLKIDFKNRPTAILQSLGLILAQRGSCQGCLLCLKAFLKLDSFRELQSYFADIVISCGSSTAAVNFVISGENQAKSVVVMRPGLLSTKRFDLVIMPRHDNPPKRKNIVVTEGALNLIDDEYLASCVLRFASCVKIEKDLVLGLLLGGDTKTFKLSLDLLKPLISQIKLFLERYDGQILITTSRRTSPEVEGLIKQEFSNYRRCRLLVIANEKNIPEAVGGILGLSKIVIVSPESISMISEAASCGRYVVVFVPQTNIGRRHTQFLERFLKERYIYLTDSPGVSRTLENIITQKPEIVKLQDSLRVKEALKKLI
jgi:KDO2-lipid IV(A) lauroyltransferase